MAEPKRSVLAERFGANSRTLGRSYVHVNRIADRVFLSVTDEDSGRGPDVVMDLDEWRQLHAAVEEQRADEARRY